MTIKTSIRTDGIYAQRIDPELEKEDFQQTRVKKRVGGILNVLANGMNLPQYRIIQFFDQSYDSNEDLVAYFSIQEGELLHLADYLLTFRTSLFLSSDLVVDGNEFRFSQESRKYRIQGRFDHDVLYVQVNEGQDYRLDCLKFKFVKGEYNAELKEKSRKVRTWI